MHRFRTHPVQTALTLAGLVVGTSAIIIIVALGLTGRTFVMSQIEGVGSHLIWASYEGTVTSGVSRTTGGPDHGCRRDARSRPRTGPLQRRDPAGRARTAPSPSSPAPLDVAILGTTPNYAAVRKNLRILPRPVPRRRRHRRSGRRSASSAAPSTNELFGNDDAADKTLRTLGMTFQVVGRVRQAGGHDGPGRGHALLDLHPGDRRVVLHADAPARTRCSPRCASSPRSRAARHDRGGPAARPAPPGLGLQGQDDDDRHQVARTISFGLIAAFIAAAAVSVVVGGVGIMNILLASVEQRTREIGVRMSVGARRRDILRQFLLEALMLGAVGSLIGVVVGLGPAAPAPVRPQRPDPRLRPLRAARVPLLLRRHGRLRRRAGTTAPPTSTRRRLFAMNRRQIALLLFPALASVFPASRPGCRRPGR